MKKTILIPTDFTVASLNTLKTALEQSEDRPAYVILMYAELLTDSISELLFYSPEKTLQSRIPPIFKEAVEILKNRFECRVDSVSIKLFHGINRNAMNIFLEAHNVGMIYLPGSYKLKTPGRAFDPTRMLKRSDIPISEIFWEQSGDKQSEQDQLASLYK